MSYLVLARKWRPRTFDEVIGQATVVRTLRNAIASGRVGHAFLFSGARGVGKTTTARLLARALNCAKGDGPTPDPCGECPSCVEIAAGTSLDVQEIDGATHNGVEQVRELRESARYNPARDRFKIWIIDEVHMLSTGAFNALLKTLEEPPPRVKFIFATTEYHKIPDTILSRCQQYDFRLVPTREILAHLRTVANGEGVSVSEEALGRIARAAEGSVRDGLSLFDQVLSFSGREVRDEDIQALLGLIDRELLSDAVRAIVAGDSLALFELVERLSEYGADQRHFVRELMLELRELLLLKVAPADSRLLSAVLPEERGRLLPLAEALSEEDLVRFLDILGKTEAELRWAQDARTTLELALLKLLHVRRLMPFAELVARVEHLEGGGATVAPAKPAARVAPAKAALAPTRGRGHTEAAPAAAEAADEPETDDSPGAPPAGGTPGTLIEQILELAAARPSLVQSLRGAEAVLDEKTLTLRVRPDFAAFADMHADEYRELAQRALGRKVQVRVVAGEHGKETEEASAEETRRAARAAAAQQEPAVRDALDIFGGRIVDVRENGSNR
jgi:DNA polymerase III subunit gamma/tau